MNQAHDGGDARTATVLQRLRAAGMRPTVPRISVLQVLQACEPRRLDADEVFRELLARGMSAGHGTVYRALKDLAEHGLALHEWRNGLNGSKAVYGARSAEAAAGDARMTCSECGCATAIVDPALQAQLRELALRQGLDFAEQPMMVVLAVCGRCARNRQAAGRIGGLPRRGETPARPSSRLAAQAAGA